MHALAQGIWVAWKSELPYIIFANLGLYFNWFVGGAQSMFFLFSGILHRVNTIFLEVSDVCMY